MKLKCNPSSKLFYINVLAERFCSNHKFKITSWQICKIYLVFKLAKKQWAIMRSFLNRILYRQKYTACNWDSSDAKFLYGDSSPSSNKMIICNS